MRGEKCAGMLTYIFSKQIPFGIVINKKSHIPTLKSKRPETGLILICSTHSVSYCNTHFRLAIIRAVDMHPEHVLASRFVVNDFWPLDDATWSEIAATLTGENCTFVLPLDEVVG